MDGDDRDLHVVPAEPGPLRALAASADRDDLEGLLDDMFGAAPTGPSRADLVLGAGGASLLVAQQLAGLATGWGVLGGCALALGLVLPARSVFRRLSGGRRGRERQRLLGDGRLVDAGDPATAQLLDAHRRVLAAAGSDLEARPAVGAAHLAVLEVASLLGGKRPASPAEREYVTTRATAVSHLASQLERGGTALQVAARDAVAAARIDLEAGTGTSSLELIRDLTEVPPQ